MPLESLIGDSLPKKEVQTMDNASVRLASNFNMSLNDDSSSLFHSEFASTPLSLSLSLADRLFLNVFEFIVERYLPVVS